MGECFEEGIVFNFTDTDTQGVMVWRRTEPTVYFPRMRAHEEQRCTAGGTAFREEALPRRVE